MTSATMRLLQVFGALAIVLLTAFVPQGAQGATNNDSVWGFSIEGASIQIASHNGDYTCTAEVVDVGSVGCSISMSDCIVTLRGAETLLGNALALPIPIPKPFCSPKTPSITPTPIPTPHPTPRPTPTPTPSPTPIQRPVIPEQPAPPAVNYVLPQLKSVRAIPGSSSVLAIWDPSGQPAGTTYTANAEPGGARCASTTTHCLITGLKNGVAYTIAITASNGVARSVTTAAITTPRADATELLLSLGVNAGSNAAGSASTVHGRGLLPGSRVTVVVHSTPQTLGEFKVGPAGTFTGTIHLPPGLEAGRHQLVASGTSINGSAISGRVAFGLDSAGRFAGTSTKAPPIRAYDPRQHPDDTIKTLSSGFALMMVAGGMASIRRRNPVIARAPRTRSGKKPSVSMSQQQFRAEAIEPGDRSRTWASPFLTRFDRWSLQLPQRLNVASPLLARLFNDAAYLRAMLGTWSLLSPLGGLVLGIIAASQTDGHAVPPSNAVLYAIILWGICDALAGFFAASAFTLCVVFSGGLGSAADLRALIAIDILFFAAILVVSATRDLRRHPATNAADAYDRFADHAVGAILAIWTVKSALGALPALTGLDLAIAKAPSGLLWAVAAFTIGRFAIETLAAHWYPERLLLVAPPEITSPPSWRAWLAVASKFAMFAFFAYSYMGNTWALWASSALMLLSLVQVKLKSKYPDWAFLAKAIPAGIIGLLFYYLLGAWSAEALKNSSSDPAKVAELGFVVLMIPGIICTAITQTARNGKSWDLTWLWRILGIPMLVLVYLIVGGTISVV